MNQEVLTFFEDMGMLVRRNYLDREMIWDTFGHLAKMWWSACKDYVVKEHQTYDCDPFFFRDFKYLVERIYEDDVKKKRKTIADLEPSRSAVKVFLETEARRPRSSIKSPVIFPLENHGPKVAEDVLLENPA
jgi:hypothetical protein